MSPSEGAHQEAAERHRGRGMPQASDGPDDGGPIVLELHGHPLQRRRSGGGRDLDPVPRLLLNPGPHPAAQRALLQRPSGWRRIASPKSLCKPRSSLKSSTACRLTRLETSKAFTFKRKRFPLRRLQPAAVPKQTDTISNKRNLSNGRRILPRAKLPVIFISLTLL